MHQHDQFYRLDAYMQLERPAETWVVQPLLPVGGLLFLYADPKVGKSWAALQLALAVSNHEHDWLGFPIRTHGRAIYLQLDVTSVLWQAEYLAPLFRQPLGLDPSDYDFYTRARDEAPFPFNILGSGYLWLKDRCATLQPTLVVIDTIRRVHKGEENDSDHMQAVIDALQAACGPAALVVIAHSNKGFMDKDGHKHENLLNDMRGSTGQVGAADTVMRLSKGSIRYLGRTQQESQLRLRRPYPEPVGLWEIDCQSAHELDHLVKCIMANPSFETFEERVCAFAARAKRSPEQAAYLLRQAGARG